MFIWVGGLGGEQGLIPYVGYLLFPYVPLKCWIIDPYIHSLLDGPSKDVWIATFNGDIMYCGIMTTGDDMVRDKKGAWNMPLTFP